MITPPTILMLPITRFVLRYLAVDIALVGHAVEHVAQCPHQVGHGAVRAARRGVIEDAADSGRAAALCLGRVALSVLGAAEGSVTAAVELKQTGCVIT